MKKIDEAKAIDAMREKMRNEWNDRPTWQFGIFECKTGERPMFFKTHQQMEDYFDEHVKPKYERS